MPPFSHLFRNAVGCRQYTPPNYVAHQLGAFHGHDHDVFPILDRLLDDRCRLVHAGGGQHAVEPTVCLHSVGDDAFVVVKADRVADDGGGV